MNFLIQTINQAVCHDFAFELQMAKPYYDYLDDDQLELEYMDTATGLCFENIKDPDRYVPVGTVEFVAGYLKSFYPEAERALEPLNVPVCLFPYAGRKIANICQREDFEPFKRLSGIYCKSLDEIKSGFNGPKYAPTGSISDWYESKDFIHCQVAELIDITSEWRVFVFNGEIQHIANYSGECMAFPDGETIRNMVEAYGNKAPKAWTLDVAVTPEGKTVVLECHRFFSCGLYGFSDLRRIPKMLSQEWFEMKNLKNK